MDHPAEEFGKLFVEQVRDRAIAGFENNEVARDLTERLTESEGDLGDIVDLIVAQTGDALIDFLTNPDRSFSELKDGVWVRASDDGEFRSEVENSVLHQTRSNCRRRLDKPGRFGRARWMQAVHDNEVTGAITFVSYIVDEVAAIALHWIEPSFSRSFTWTDNGTTRVLETLDDLSYQYFEDNRWSATYSRYPPFIA